MSKLRATVVALVFLTLGGLVLSAETSGASTKNVNPPSPRANVSPNKFVALWHSQITFASGAVAGDGDINVTDASPANADRVSVVHSLRGGPFSGYTMSYPDRIEVQMPLTDGRVAHYNGVLVSADRVEGRYWVTGGQQSHHSRKAPKSNRASANVDEDEGTWVITKP